jgi:hypothetical protein
MTTIRTPLSDETFENILQFTAGEKPFHYLQESHKDNIISNTNNIIKRFNDELDTWRRTKDAHKEFDEKFEK